MSWGTSIETMALVAKERHAQMLAYSLQQQKLAQMLPRPEGERTTWQWLRQTVFSVKAHGRDQKGPAMHQPLLQR